MPELSPILSLPYLQPAQAQKHVTHNEALRILDAVTQLSVLSTTLTDPPALPDNGDRYIVAAPATAAWTGQEGNIATWSENAWLFYAPDAGWRADVEADGSAVRFDGTNWVAPTLPDLQNIPVIGVNTTADVTNRLAVSADATLLNNAGSGHQLKLNKAAAADTASLLFQTGFSGRAEMGTAGTDDFAIKVSPDGTTFKSALTIDADNASVQVNTGQQFFEDVYLLDDTAYSFDVPWSDPSRVMMWIGTNIAGRFYLVAITGSLLGAANLGEMFANPAGTLNFFTGPLTGTTGPDGEISLSIENDSGTKRMYVENRLGSNRFFTLATMGK